jgi:hypothetical protein
MLLYLSWQFEWYSWTLFMPRLGIGNIWFIVKLYYGNLILMSFLTPSISNEYWEHAQLCMFIFTTGNPHPLIFTWQWMKTKAFDGKFKWVLAPIFIVCYVLMFQTVRAWCNKKNSSLFVHCCFPCLWQMTGGVKQGRGHVGFVIQ